MTLNRYHLEIRIVPRPGLLDPQGKAIHHALHALEFTQVDDVRVGKAIYLDLDAASPEAALETADAMCRKLLANPVTEDFTVSLLEDAAGAAAGEGA